MCVALWQRAYVRINLKTAFSCGLLKSLLCDCGLARYRLMYV